MTDLSAYREAWNDSFSFTFVDPAQLTQAEQDVFALTGPAAKLAGVTCGRGIVKEVLISETMRLNESGRPVLGLWDEQHQRIIIQRDELATPARWCGTMLHELAHARSGEPDGSLEFEGELTSLLGEAVARSLTAGLDQSARSSAGRKGAAGGKGAVRNPRLRAGPKGV